MNKKLLTLIPSTLTFLNMACGLWAIIILFAYPDYYLNVPIVGILYLGSIIADVLDGWTARKLNVSTEIGEFFDSFADLISFGVAPAFLILSVNGNTELWAFLLIGFTMTIYVGGCLYRLARYNVRHSVASFEGFPTMLAGLIITLFCVIWHFCSSGSAVLDRVYIGIIIPLCVILSVLMVSRIKINRIF